MPMRMLPRPRHCTVKQHPPPRVRRQPPHHSLCRLWHLSFGLFPPLLLAPCQDLPTQAAPASGRADFASATLVQATKPPIA